MSSWDYRPPLPDCPNCGKKEGAYMGDSAWGHDVSCCSDECGQEIAEKLRKNREGKEYREALKDYREAEKRVMKAKYKGVDAIGFRDRLPNRRDW